MNNLICPRCKHKCSKDGTYTKISGIKTLLRRKIMANKRVNSKLIDKLIRKLKETGTWEIEKHKSIYSIINQYELALNLLGNILC